MQNIAPNVAAILHIARGYLRCSALHHFLPPVVAIHRISADIRNSFPQTLRDLLQETSDYPRALCEIAKSLSN